MFKKRMMALVGLWMAVVLASFRFFQAPAPADYADYEKLMAYSDISSKLANKSKSFTTRQQRYHVSKQVLFKKGQERLQWRLKSERSELKFGQQAYSIELVEHFKNLFCVMQEKVVSCSEENCRDLPSSRKTIDSTQWIRCLQARQAVYHYKTEQLVAENVFLSRYVVPGYEWIENLQSFTPVMEGKAANVQLSFLKGDLSFKAHGLQATFQDWGKAF